MLSDRNVADIINHFGADTYDMMRFSDSVRRIGIRIIIITIPHIIKYV